MGLSDYAVHKLLEHMVAKTAYTPAATLYMGLCTADPTNAATGASCNETANAHAYARTAVTFSSAAARGISNSLLVRFPNATGTYAAAITHWVITDSGTYGAGNVLAHGAFTASATPLIPTLGYYVRVPSAAINISLPVTSGMGLCDTRCNNLLDLMFRNIAFSVPAVYLRLSASVPTELGSFSEISGAGYAALAFSSWSTAASREIHNSSTITFGPPTGDWTPALAVVMSISSTTLTDIIAYDAVNFIDIWAVNSDTVTMATTTGFSISIT